MFKIYKGGDTFFQWDIGQRLIVEDPEMDKVHFCNKTGECSLVCEVYEEDGLRLVNVPNILLQVPYMIRVYGCLVEGEDSYFAKNVQIFKVIARTKPEDYVYTEEELKNFNSIEERINIRLEELEAEHELNGYYTPSIDEEGNLSWTGSKEAMPEAPTVNIKGEKGDKGEDGTATDEQVNAWLDAHPEATTSVLDGSLTEAKLTDDLKKKVINNYVTPEMYDAVGNGIANDTEAVQRAIDANLTVVLTKRYVINNLVLRDNSKIIMHGSTLVVNSGYGFIINCSNASIEGGTIELGSESLGGVLINVENEVFHNKICTNIKSVLFDENSNLTDKIGILISENGGSGAYNTIKSTITECLYGIKSEQKQTGGWFTQLYVDSDLIGCVKAIHLLTDCAGSSFKGSIQPCYIRHIGENEDPLCVLPGDSYFESKIWDLSLMANKYAIAFNGKNIHVARYIPEQYIYSNGFTNQFLLSRQNSRKCIIPSVTTTNPFYFTQINNILHNADFLSIFSQKTIPSVIGGLFRGEQATISYAPSLGDLTSIFEFKDKHKTAIRAFIVLGEKLPAKIKLLVKTVGSEDYIELAEMNRGIDYFDSGDAMAVWNYEYDRDHDKIGGFDSKNIIGIKIILCSDSSDTSNYRISHIGIYNTENHTASTKGCRFTGQVHMPAPELNESPIRKMDFLEVVNKNDSTLFGKKIIFNEDGSVTWENVT